jgi:hypothetical protein
MRFTHETLSATRKDFSKALEARGLSLPFQTELNLWSKIVTGKNFPAAAPSCDQSGGMDAIPVSADAIRAALRRHSRDVSEIIAVELFSDAVGRHLGAISYCMANLVRLLKTNKSRCLIKAGRETPGIGLMDTKQPGYIPLARMEMFIARPDESVWIATSAKLVVEAVHRLAGIGREQSIDIFAKNHRLSDERSDLVFMRTIEPRLEECSLAVAERINRLFDPADIEDWEAVDFDIVRDAVYDSLTATIGNDHASWLSIDCDIAEAMIDHVAARIRDGMKWTSREADDGEASDQPLNWVAWTAQLSMEKILKRAAGPTS